MSSGWTTPTLPPSYNQNPPPDDNTQTEANAVKWNAALTAMNQTRIQDELRIGQSVPKRIVAGNMMDGANGGHRKTNAFDA